MVKKTSSAVTLHELSAISYWVTCSTPSWTFCRTPRALLTPSLPNQYAAQTCRVLDIIITCLRAFREYSKVARALRQVSHLEGFCLEGIEFVPLIVICHVGAQTTGAETISPRDSIKWKRIPELLALSEVTIRKDVEARKRYLIQKAQFWEQ